MFEAGAQSKTSTDLPFRLAQAARNGDVDTVRRWLAAGGSPDASKTHAGNTISLLEVACNSSRPSNAEIVGLLCAAGVNVNPGGDGAPICIASRYGAEVAVRHLLRAGASVHGTLDHAGPLHNAVMGNNWFFYKDPWSIDQAKSAASIGHQGIVRMLLAHGAAVDESASSSQSTALHVAARLAGFISLGVVKELLRQGASLDAVDAHLGLNAEGHARNRLHDPVYTGDGIPETPQLKRRPGAVEAFLALLADVRAAGSFKRYANEPRLQLVVLRKLAESGRAVATRGVATRLFAPRRRLQAMGSRALPDELFWRILQFWRTDRDP